METLHNQIQLCQVAAERLTQYLHTLPADAWRHPSACEAWEVRDVVAHLVMGAELYMRVISRGVQGDVSPLEGFPPARLGYPLPTRPRSPPPSRKFPAVS